MNYLADVNVLVALSAANHADHAKTRGWLASLDQGDGLVTCSITELGFVRVSIQIGAAADVAQARKGLAQIRARPGHAFLSDHLGADALPAWVKAANQTTDGHLAALAKAHGAELVTLDTRIPGAVQIR